MVWLLVVVIYASPDLVICSGGPEPGFRLRPQTWFSRTMRSSGPPVGAPWPSLHRPHACVDGSNWITEPLSALEHVVCDVQCPICGA